jgi:integrase
VAQGDVSSGLAGLRLHDLRHFFASGLIASGCDVVTVQRALGHSSATTTLNTYGHLWPDSEDRIRAATDDLMAAALDDPADFLRTERRSRASEQQF